MPLHRKRPSCLRQILKPQAEAPLPMQSAAPAEEPEPPKAEAPAPAELTPMPPLPRTVQNAVQHLHAQWAAEEAALRRSQPEFSLQKELRDPEMRRLMQLPGMRVQDAYRLVHYNDSLNRAAQAVEQGVVQRIQQPPYRKRHPPRRCSHDPPGCGQHDPRPAGSPGTPCAARGADRTVNPTEKGKNL